MRFAREAFVWVAPWVVLALFAAVRGAAITAGILALVAVAVLLFFRIPPRRPSLDAGAVLAPANGVVTRIDRVSEPKLGGGESQRIVTFLSVFNVHVQRAPVAGEVVESVYTPGRKVAAFRADAGEVNENHWTVLADVHGRHIGVKQIAGLLARRVVSYGEPGRRFERGELIGIIKFGSRVDLYLPVDYELAIEPGAKLIEGESVVAYPPTRVAEAAADGGAKDGSEE